MSEQGYHSDQHTRCAVCGIDKHAPLRRDEMGGYVCLTCIDTRLDELSALKAQRDELLEAAKNTVTEFERLRESAKSIKDAIYLDGVLAVLDNRLRAAIVNAEKGKQDEC